MSQEINSTESRRSPRMTPSFSPLPSSWREKFEFYLALESFYCEVTESSCPTTQFVHSALDIFNDNVQPVLDYVTKILDAPDTP